MKKHLLVFVGMFAAGALAAFATRVAQHDPYSPTSAAPEPEAPHAHAAAPAEAPAAASEPAKPVNTVCALCGMKVNPSIPTETFQGHAIGFGCKACPPKFRADPEKYGPLALRNEVAGD